MSLDGTVAGRSPDFSSLRYWLEDCINNPDCGQKRQQAWPTRLLYEGSPRLQTLRLVEKKQEIIEPANGHGYAALSHRWGHPGAEEKERICLYDKNYHERLARFGLDELPKTFQDAVRVTGLLGLSLLWIDALCINQTNPTAPESDWSKEAARMQDVFSSVSLTISTTSAKNWI